MPSGKDRRHFDRLFVWHWCLSLLVAGLRHHPIIGLLPGYIAQGALKAGQRTCKEGHVFHSQPTNILLSLGTQNPPRGTLALLLHDTPQGWLAHMLLSYTGSSTTKAPTAVMSSASTMKSEPFKASVLRGRVGPPTRTRAVGAGPRLYPLWPGRSAARTSLWSGLSVTKITRYVPPPPVPNTLVLCCILLIIPTGPFN